MYQLQKATISEIKNKFFYIEISANKWGIGLVLFALKCKLNNFLWWNLFTDLHSNAKENYSQCNNTLAITLESGDKNSQAASQYWKSDSLR